MCGEKLSGLLDLGGGRGSGSRQGEDHGNTRGESACSSCRAVRRSWWTKRGVERECGLWTARGEYQSSGQARAVFLLLTGLPPPSTEASVRSPPSKQRQSPRDPLSPAAKTPSAGAGAVYRYLRRPERDGVHTRPAWAAGAGFARPVCLHTRCQSSPLRPWRALQAACNSTSWSTVSSANNAMLAATQAAGDVPEPRQRDANG